jgi:hypothetical protein
MVLRTAALGAGIAGAMLSLAACETAFVGEAPSGRYDLVRVEGRALPFARNVGGCSRTVTAGHFDLDSVARRFQLELSGTDSCAGSASVRESGTYLRRGGTLTLETEGPAPRALTASESGRTVSLLHDGLALRFTRRAAR